MHACPTTLTAPPARWALTRHEQRPTLLARSAAGTARSRTTWHGKRPLSQSIVLNDAPPAGRISARRGPSQSSTAGGTRMAASTPARHPARPERCRCRAAAPARRSSRGSVRSPTDHIATPKVRRRLEGGNASVRWSGEQDKGLWHALVAPRLHGVKVPAVLEVPEELLTWPGRTFVQRPTRSDQDDL
jgi:hypothetical protein